MVREYLHTNRHGEFVFCAMNRKYAMHLHGGVARGRDYSLYAVRTKNDFREFCAFENVFMHPPVAAAVAALARGCGSDECAAH